MLTLADFVNLAKEGVPLNTPIQPVWAWGPPPDSEPAVAIHDIRMSKDGREIELGVRLVPLDEIEDEQEVPESCTPVWPVWMRGLVRITVEGEE
jgi:hypothetical protein